MKQRLLRGMGLAILAGSALAAAVCRAAYRREMRQAFARALRERSLLSTPCGEVEYTARGTGLPVLVIHGSGGGCDQGELIAEVLLGQGFQAICPSRFGYLRSTFHPGATFDDQAHAYAALLDHLGVARAAVVAVSHGGPSALLLAALHPQRVSSITLISAGVVTVASPEQGQANRMGQTLKTIFQHDWLYWALTRLFQRQFMTLMGASPAVIARLTPDQRKLVRRVIAEMNPVSLRSAGTIFDNQAALPGERIASIDAPALILHARDDTLQRFHNAAFAAAAIPGAKLRAFDQGGHLLFAVECEAVRSAVQAHIRAGFSQENAFPAPQC